MAYRGIILSHETVRFWCYKFASYFQDVIRKKESWPSDKWHLDEMNVKINGENLTANKLVAQLSQNMNFVMDVSVEDFIRMHAKSRNVKELREITKKIIKYANELAGEKFTSDVPITQLSGGQSRSLMDRR